MCTKKDAKKRYNINIILRQSRNKLRIHAEENTKTIKVQAKTKKQSNI